MLINTEKKKKEIEEFINDKILHKQIWKLANGK